MNFGQLKEIFTDILVEAQLNNDENGKNLYKKFLKEVKNDDILKTQYIVYKNLESKGMASETSAVEYIKQNVSVFEGVTGVDVDKSNEKLQSLLDKKEVIIKNNPLYEAIHLMITKKKGPSTINKLHEASELVKSSLMSEVEVGVSDDSQLIKDVDANQFLDIVVNKFNEKYSELTEEEKKIINVLETGGTLDREDLIKTMTNETMDIINKMIDDNDDDVEVVGRLLKVKDKVYRTNYDENFQEGVMKLYNLKKDLKEQSE